MAIEKNNTTKPGFPPANIFISYSHKDEKDMLRFCKALAPLKRRGLINEWYDGKIVPGNEIENEIMAQLDKAQIIFLLLSPSYIESDYCWNIEREKALELHEKNNVRVVGIIIREVILKGLELTYHKLLPKDMKPLPMWRPADHGWSNVCEGIEQVIDDIRNPSQVDGALYAIKTGVTIATSAAQNKNRNKQSAGKVKSLAYITDFWKQVGSAVLPDSLVSISGTFSQFAPMLMGSPKAKARLHKSSGNR